MNNLKNITTFYFVGIGGIGMSALARYFKMQGKAVFGYDKTSTDLTDELVAEGIPVTFTDEISELQSEVKVKHNVLIVYTPAIPKNNTVSIINFFISINFYLVLQYILF